MMANQSGRAGKPRGTVSGQGRRSFSRPPVPAGRGAANRTGSSGTVPPSGSEVPGDLWPPQRTMLLGLAVLVFLVLWPLQMHHWFGEVFMNRGMLVKNRIDTCEEKRLAVWPVRDEYYGKSIDELYDGVYALFEKSIRFYPQYMETFYIVGRYYIDGGSYDLQVNGRRTADRLDRGREVLLQDIYMNPNYKWAHNNLGVIYDKLAQVVSMEGRYDLSALYRDYARDHYLVALDIDPDQIFALFNLGNGYLREGLGYHRIGQVESASPLMAKARHFMERCVVVQPYKMDCYELLSQILLHEKDYAALADCLEEYFARLEKKGQKVPEDYFYQTLSTAYLKAEKPIPPNPAARPEGPVDEGAPPLTNAERGRRARDLLLKVREMDEDAGRKSSPDVARQLADAYVLLGDHEKALEEYERLIEGGMRDPIVYYDAARIALRAGLLDEAREYVKSILNDPRDPRTMHRLITSDPLLAVLTAEPWFKELEASLGLTAPASATDAVSPKPGEPVDIGLPMPPPGSEVPSETKE